MSQTVGVFDAKAQFSSIVDRAEHGEETVITRHGRAVARIGPVAPAFDQAKVRAAAQGLKTLRDELKAQGVRISHEEIRGWINEGRP